MERKAFDHLLHRVQSDPTFRMQLLTDPEVAMSQAGIDLQPYEMTAFKEWHAGMRDATKVEELTHSLEEFFTNRLRKAG